MALPFPSHTFNAVISSSLINIVQQPAMVLREFSRVCQSGGTISVLMPRQGFTNAQLDSLATRLDINGFELAVLHAWHRNAPKMSDTNLAELFNLSQLPQGQSQQMLQGMVLVFTVQKRL